MLVLACDCHQSTAKRRSKHERKREQARRKESESLIDCFHFRSQILTHVSHPESCCQLHLRPSSTIKKRKRKREKKERKERNVMAVSMNRKEARSFGCCTHKGRERGSNRNMECVCVCVCVC